MVTYQTMTRSLFLFLFLKEKTLRKLGNFSFVFVSDNFAKITSSIMKERNRPNGGS